MESDQGQKRRRVESPGEGDKDREARQSARWWIGSSQLGEGGEKDKDGEVNGDGDGGADGDGEDELEEADELEEDELEEMVEPRVSPPPVLEHDNDDEAYTLLLDYVRILRTELQFGLPTMYKEQHFVRLPKHPVFVVPGRGRNWLHDRAIFLWLPLLLPGVESIPCPAGLPGCKDLSDDGFRTDQAALSVQTEHGKTWLLSNVLRCKNCGKGFMATDDRILSRLPSHIRYCLPALPTEYHARMNAQREKLEWERHVIDAVPKRLAPATDEEPPLPVIKVSNKPRTSRRKPKVCGNCSYPPFQCPYLEVCTGRGARHLCFCLGVRHGENPIPARKAKPGMVKEPEPEAEAEPGETSAGAGAGAGAVAGAGGAGAGAAGAGAAAPPAASAPAEAKELPAPAAAPSTSDATPAN